MEVLEKSSRKYYNSCEPFYEQPHTKRSGIGGRFQRPSLWHSQHSHSSLTYNVKDQEMSKVHTFNTHILFVNTLDNQENNSVTTPYSFYIHVWYTKYLNIKYTKKFQASKCIETRKLTNMNFAISTSHAFHVWPIFSSWFSLVDWAALMLSIDWESLCNCSDGDLSSRWR